MDTTVKSSGQELLIPRKKTNERKQRSILLEVNSRDRNVSSYPHPNAFRWNLQRPLKDIQTIQIVGGTFPTRIFNVNTGYNQFTFQEDRINYTVTINPGRYTLSSYSIEIGSKINNLPGLKNQYSVQISPTTDQLTISQDSGLNHPFALLFGSGDFVDLYQGNILLQINSPAKQMGFLSQDYSDNGTRCITSPYATELNYLHNRVYLYINVETSQDLTTIERSVGKRDPYTIIYMDEDERPYKYFDKVTFEPSYLSSPAPVARVRAFDVEIRDEFYRLVELNGRDFTLLLEVVYLE
jgi:hypothetical protein